MNKSSPHGESFSSPASGEDQGGGKTFQRNGAPIQPSPEAGEGKTRCVMKPTIPYATFFSLGKIPMRSLITSNSIN